MPILTSGSNVTLTVAAGQILTVQSDQATFDFENPVGTRVGEYAADTVFGPFASAGSVKVTSVQGPLFYELANRPVGQSVPFDPSSVAITGGTIDGQPIITAATLPKWRRALARVASGTGNARILCVGDSTTAGTGSVSGGVGAGLKTLSYPSLLANLFANAGIPATAQSCFGDFGYGVNAPTYDPRLVAGNWTQTGVITCLAGLVYQATAATASPLAFTPTISTDTCEIHYSTSPTTGSFNANVNSGSNTLVNTTAANGATKTTITGTLGANVYNCLWASGGTTFVNGFIAYNSAIKQVHVVNMGRGGAKASDLNAAWQGAAPHIAAIAPDLTIIEIGINDWIGSTSLTSFTASMQTLISAALAVGDCIVAAPMYSNPAQVPGNIAAAVQTQYAAAVLALAAANSIPFVDTNYRFGGYAVGNANGLYYTDGIHGSALGYADVSRLLTKLLNV